MSFVFPAFLYCTLRMWQVAGFQPVDGDGIGQPVSKHLVDLVPCFEDGVGPIVGFLQGALDPVVPDEDHGGGHEVFGHVGGNGRVVMQ